MRYHKHLFHSAIDCLNAIFFEDRHADKCIEFYLRNNKKWGSRDRRFFAETVYDCVRWWSLYWAVVNSKPGKVDFKILGVSLWHRDMAFPEWPEFQSMTANDFKKSYNAIEGAHTKQAMPRWLYQKMLEDIGPEWSEMAPYFNRTNQLVLRVNTLNTTVQKLISECAKLGIEAKPLMGTETGLIIKERTNVFRTELFKKGLFEVQDGSSQQVATYLQVEPGMRVIDACAGAGGKTLHIADILKNKGKIISLDIHQWKLDQLKLRARRNQYSNIEMKVIDGTKTIKRMKASADRLLLDVPCSGLGVLRRNPDTKWKVSEQSIDEMIKLQKEILSGYSAMLKPGGKMIYATCSVLPSENEEQVADFLSSNSQFRLLKQRKLYPTRDGYDGFFMALMERKI